MSDAPTPAAVRKYLAEFLADPRVVEIPRVAWALLLHGVVLRTRPARSAARYRSIWTNDGSPLLVHSVKQRILLLGYLGQRLKEAGFPSDACPVELGMRYGQPALGDALDKLRAAACEKIGLRTPPGDVTRDMLALPILPRQSRCPRRLQRWRNA